MKRPDRHRVLGGKTRARLMSALAEAGRPCSVRELADGLGLHPNSVREQLRVLQDADMVSSRSAAPTGRGRPRTLYSLRRGPDPDAPHRRLARVLAEQLERSSDPSRAAIEAGEHWGAAMAGPTEGRADPDSTRRRLIDLLHEAGFEPQTVAGEPGVLRLLHCPFEPLARDHRTVVCGVHLGLMRGALREYGASVDGLELLPFAEPGACLAQTPPEMDVTTEAGG